MKPTESNTILFPATMVGSGDEPGVADAQVRRIMAEVMARRARGEVLSDDHVLREHPDLRPQLEEELDGLRMLRNALLAAQKAGPLEDPITPLAPAELETPIDPPPDAVTPWDDPRRPLHVQGY